MSFVTINDVLEHCNVSVPDTEVIIRQLIALHENEGSIIDGCDVLRIDQRNVLIKESFVFLRNGIIKHVPRTQLSLDSIVNYYHYDATLNVDTLFVGAVYKDVCKFSNANVKVLLVDPEDYTPTEIVFLGAIRLHYNFVQAVFPEITVKNYTFKRRKTCDILSDITSQPPQTEATVLNCYSKEFSNATDLTIEHNLASRCITYNIVDDIGQQVFPDSFTVLDSNKVIIKFKQPVSGKVTLFTCNQVEI